MVLLSTALGVLTHGWMLAPGKWKMTTFSHATALKEAKGTGPPAKGSLLPPHAVVLLVKTVVLLSFFSFLFCFLVVQRRRMRWSVWVGVGCRVIADGFGEGADADVEHEG